MPHKNMRKLDGRPLIDYTIEAALASKRLSKVIVSTDDPQIAQFVKSSGVEAPFMRPKELSGDAVSDKQVLLHAVNWCNGKLSYKVDLVVILRPTTPFKTGVLIDAAIELLIDSKADSVRTVSAVDGVHHPYWMFRADALGKAQAVVPGIKISDYYQRQLLPDVYRLNGVVDVINVDILLNHEELYGDEMRLMPIAETQSYDIDTEDDFSLCELRINKYK